MATGTLTLTVAGLYACSDDETPAITTPPGQEAGSDTSTGADTSTGIDSSPGVDSGTDTGNVPTACPIFENDSGRIPTYEPSACRVCAAQKCCTPITKCYGGAPADAGFDGSNGTKTNCELVGECEEKCAGSAVCETQCQVDYGMAVSDDFSAVGTCVEAPVPAGCLELCN